LIGPRVEREIKRMEPSAGGLDIVELVGLRV
jgi:hypothetical protein